AGNVRREAGERSLDRGVQVGVAGDEEIRTPVAVYVGDRGPGVPARGSDERGPGETAVPVVPEHIDAGRRVDDEVREAVAVQVRCDAPVDVLWNNGHGGFT